MNGDAFSGLVSVLQGTACPPPVETCAWDDLSEVIRLLRSIDSDAARRWADALTSYLVGGGDLQQQLGLKLPRGGSHLRPAKASNLARRDDLIRQHASAIPGGRKAVAAELARRIHCADPSTRVLRELYPDLPTSQTQLVRILRGDRST